MQNYSVKPQIERICSKIAQELEEYKSTGIRFAEQEVRKDMVNVLRTIENHIFRAPFLRKQLWNGKF